MGRDCCWDFPKSEKNLCNYLLSIWKIPVFGLTLLLLPAKFPVQFLFYLVMPS